LSSPSSKIPSRTTHFQGHLCPRRVLSSFVFQVSSTRFELKQAFFTLSNSYLPRVLGGECSDEHVACHVPGHEYILLSADLSLRSRESLGHISLEQMDLLGTHFQPYGQVPWNELIYPLWSSLIFHVEEACWPLTRASCIRMRSACYLSPYSNVWAELPPPECFENASFVIISVLRRASAPDLASGCLC